jgi:hypothetical protein
LETVTDTARVLLTGGVLSALAMAVVAWRLTRTDPSHPNRLIGELRLAQLGAILLALTGGIWLGLAIAHDRELFAGLDASLGIIFAIVAAMVLLLEPRQALLVLALAFAGHAVVDIGHRPDWLSVAVAPRWFIVGCALYDVFIAALCFWARRR